MPISRVSRAEICIINKFFEGKKDRCPVSSSNSSLDARWIQNSRPPDPGHAGWYGLGLAARRGAARQAAVGR